MLSRCTGALRAVGAGRSLAGSRALTVTALDTSAQHKDEEIEEFRQTVETFARDFVAPHAADIDRNNSFPTSVNLWKAMGEWGLHGITVPSEYGGLGLGYLHHCVAMEEISRASGPPPPARLLQPAAQQSGPRSLPPAASSPSSLSPAAPTGSVALSYGAHSNLCISQLVRHGTDAQKAKYLPRLLTGAQLARDHPPMPCPARLPHALPCPPAPRPALLACLTPCPARPLHDLPACPAHAPHRRGHWCSRHVGGGRR
jgi:isovaleryl-CoA dehydrogenase